MKKRVIFSISVSLVLALFLAVVSMASGGFLSFGNDFQAVDKPVRFVAAGSGSDKYSLEVDENSLAVKVTERASGRVVLESGNILPDGGGDDEYDNGLNTKWERFAKSAISVYYSTETIYKSLLEFNHSINLKSTDSGFTAKINIKEIGLKLDLVVSLNGDYLDVKIPSSSIVESNADKNPLLSIVVYPFLNSSRGVQAGSGNNYIFVPDGSGALIDLTQKTLAKNAYEGRVYGNDIGMSGSGSVTKYGANPPRKVTYPAFGMANGGNGYIAHIGSGAEYSNIKAFCSGITTDYNFVYNTFIYRENYLLPVDNKGTKVSRYQTEKNVYDAAVRYMILPQDENSYSHMAQRYKANLEEKQILLKRLPTNAPSSIKLDFLMADNYDKSIGRETVVMTTADYVQSALGYMQDNGVKNIISALQGYTKGGVTGAAPKHANFEGKTGSDGDYAELIKFAGEKGIRLFPTADYNRVVNGRGGYAKKDISMSLSKEFLMLPDYFAETSKLDYEFYQLMHPQSTKKYFNADMDKFVSMGFDTVQLSVIGNTLYSNNFNSSLTRTQSMASYKEMLAKSGMTSVLENPSQYMWKDTAYSADTPLTNSRFMIALEAVPFLQMVTSGYINHYRDYVNLNSSAQNDVLKMVDFNVFPSFIFTQKSSYDLYLTNSSYVFSSMFDDWKDKAVDVYKRTAAALDSVNGQKFVSRKALSTEVYENEYENGVRILVNYSDNDFQSAYGTVLKNNYKVVN